MIAHVKLLCYDIHNILMNMKITIQYIVFKVTHVRLDRESSAILETAPATVNVKKEKHATVHHLF